MAKKKSKKSKKWFEDEPVDVVDESVDVVDGPVDVVDELVEDEEGPSGPAKSSLTESRALYNAVLREHRELASLKKRRNDVGESNPAWESLDSRIAIIEARLERMEARRKA